ncbi:MAG: PqqD family protein [Pseudomonadota bacterium]
MANAGATDYRPRIKNAKDEVIVEKVLDELVVYDLKRRKFHTLNETATRIWALIDGKRSVPEIARKIRGDLDLDEENAVGLVLACLNQLSKARLLEPDTHDRFVHTVDTKRRRLLHAMGGVVVLPVVASISAPTPAQTLSLDCARCCALGKPCLNPGGECSNSDEGDCTPQIHCGCPDVFT